MTPVLLRIFKTLLLLILIAGAALTGFARWKLEGLARRVAALSLAGTGVRTGAIHARSWPPAAVIDDLVVKTASGEELLRARKVVLPLGPGAWIGHGRLTGTPLFSGFSLKLRLGRSTGISLPAGLPDWPEWNASDGRVEVRAGESPAPIVLALAGVRASRRAGRITLDGTVEGEPARVAHLEGEWNAGRLSAKTSLGALPAMGASALLIAPPAIARGGEVTFEGTLVLDARRAQFRGDVDARDVIVVGDGASSALENRLRAGRGHARIPLVFDVDVTQGADWARVVREAIEAGAR